ncbi:type IV toxin-antitoxin system AbiEi family antitoxin domain-containing protein [Mycolicibacterium llatzerense]|uniref:type IV toxin-antitoxin system AbiEi family antitoxin domain-containing protein n=1 Tax=Mycolicibacterium llatzerense TaxID=280871 RepID=UPI0021B546F9|nr:type IV toxin-antitoxin system AbiEi family antitoxin domain-containing protein [Mycolicibacterium llatzerense]MCT7371923.1 hypothetical protein [Mycolicibacterium llatzerense]
MVSTDRHLQLAEVAESQWGMVTTAQAADIAVSAQQLARMTNRGVLQRLHHGVYLITGVPYDRLTDLKATWLALEPGTLAAARLDRPDPGGVVSHRSAARVHGIGDLDADLNEFTVTTARRSRNADTRLHKRALPSSAWEIVDGLPVTTVAITISDLAAGTTDGGHLAGVLDDALTQGKITREEAAAALRPFAHQYGAPLGAGRELLDRLLAAHDGPPDGVSL